MLRYRRAIPKKNYVLWMAEAMRLAPRGIATMAQANKMYLRGVQGFCGEEGRSLLVYSALRTPVLHEGQTKTSDVQDRGEKKGRQARMPVPLFFAEAMERVAWHAGCGHAIVIVSGTLAPLAKEVAIALGARLAVRGIAASIGVCATRLEEVDGTWTGRIVGEAMFGEAKARAVRRLAAEERFELARCYAYGDSASDRWLLEAAGRPAAVSKFSIVIPSLLAGIHLTLTCNPVGSATRVSTSILSSC